MRSSAPSSRSSPAIRAAMMSISRWKKARSAAAARTPGPLGRAAIPQWIADKKIYILVQIGLKRAADLPDVPLMSELAKNDEDRQVLTFISSDMGISRAFVTTPGVPPERLAALRQAFMETMKDPDFLAEAAKTQDGHQPLLGRRGAKGRRLDTRLSRRCRGACQGFAGGADEVRPGVASFHP